MTVSSTTSRWEYTGDGSTTGFTYSNKIFLSSELQVYLDNVLQTETTHYTVSGAGQSAGGTVTFVTAPTTDASVVIIRSVPNTQSTDYPSGGSLPSGVIEDDIDRRTIVSQQTEEKLSRAIVTPAGEPQLDMTLPATATRASKYMGFDSNGQPVELDAPTSTTALSTYGAKIGVAADFDDTQALLNLDTSVTTGGSSTVYTLTPAETITAYEDGMVWAVDFHTACGASPTINIDTVGAKSLVWGNGTALAANDVAAGQKAFITYDGTDMIVLTAGGRASRYDIGADAGEIAVNEQDWTDVASAATVDVFGAATESVNITGTTGISAFTTATAGLVRRIKFAGALTLTHNGTSFILPGGMDFTTAAGDTAEVISEGSGNARFLWIQKADGTALIGAITNDTMVDATNSGANDLTEVTFTGISSAAKRIVVMFDEVSLTGTDDYLIQLGDSGGYETTGYVSGSFNSTVPATVNSTSGFIVNTGAAGITASGAITLSLMDSSTNLWVASHSVGTGSTQVLVGGGKKALSATLDRLKVTVTGTDTFDNGNINISVE